MEANTTAGSASGKNPTLGFFMSNFGNYQEMVLGGYHQRIWSGAARVAEEYNANVVCFIGGHLNSQVGFQKHWNVIYDLASPANLDGLIMVAATMKNYITVEEMAQFCARYAPLPIISIALELEDIPSITIDNVLGLRALMAHLIDDHHYRRLAFIRGPEPNLEAEVRYRAYTEALKDHGIPFDPSLVAPGDFAIDAGIEAVRLLLDRRKVSFDAIVAGNDNMAIGAWQELTRRGINVPTDVAVTGFDDMPGARTFATPLTTIRQPLIEQGRQAARMLLEHLQHGAPLENLVLGTELIIRESCGCVSPALSSLVPIVPVDVSESILTQQRDIVLADIQKTICPYFSDVPLRSIELLVDAFFDGLQGNPTAQFLPLFSYLLKISTTDLSLIDRDRGVVARWQEVLSILREKALPYKRSGVTVDMDGLLYQGGILVTEVAERTYSNLLSHAVANIMMQFEVARDINAASDTQQVIDTLAQDLPRLGIRTCTLALYEGKPIPPLSSRLVMAYHDRERIDLEAGGRLFPSEQLIPPDVLPSNKPPFLIIHPLAARDIQFGFIVMEMVIGHWTTTSNTYEEFVEQIGSALYSALLAQEIAASNRKLAQRADELASANAELERANLELEKAEKNAEEASRAKSVFLANMSHELRTPLNAIIGYSELVEEECIDLEQEELIPDLKKIQAAAKHLLALVNDILDLSKIEAGKMDLYLETIDVPRMMSDIEVTVAPLMEKNANRLAVNCPGNLGTIYADLTKVRQIVFNLLSNAAKFTENGDVRLDVSRRAGSGESWIVFSVTDTGIGMTPAQMSKLFADFSQADSSTTRKYGGTGLGLSISKRFCQMMGGDIAAQSEYGKGSTFTVQLPAAVHQTKPELKPADIQPVMTLPEAITVLVIDDDPTVRELVSRHLGKEGFHVETAGSGQEGIQRARVLCPQVITLDVMMPGMDGWAVLSTLKADPELASIPVVMMTIVSDKAMGFALGASDYLTKPVDREQLVNILRRYEPHKLKASILIVEDDVNTRTLLATLLRKEGWKITEAENGQIALRRVAEARPALILLDLMMPEMNGFDFIDELRKTEDWRSIPIVVVTAMSLTPEDRLRLTEQAQKVLMKGSFSHDRLLEEVRLSVAAITPRQFMEG